MKQVEAPDLKKFDSVHDPTSVRSQHIQAQHIMSKQTTSKDKMSKTQYNNTKTDVTQTLPSDGDSFLKIPNLVFLRNLGGFDYLTQKIEDLIVRSLLQPELFAKFGAHPPSGILLIGPSGCGKTALAHAIANELNDRINTQNQASQQSVIVGKTGLKKQQQRQQISFFPIDAPQLITSKTGETEQILRSLFEEAKQKAPSLVFIDQIDIIAVRNDSAQREFEKRLTAQLCTCLDTLSGSNVLVLAATSRITQLEPALRRPGRFDAELELQVPNKMQRKQIIQQMLPQIQEQEFIDQLSVITPGYVPADFHQLVRAAAIDCMNKAQDDLKIENFTNVIKSVQPSSKREGFSSVPEFSLSDIGGLKDVKRLLDLWVIRPIMKPEIYQRLGLPISSGIILFGAPGNGKSLLGRAIAGQSECNFLSVKGPELLNQYVGESERAVRQLFDRARAARPVVLFLDECECLCRRRGMGNNSEVTDRVVNQFLTELDGVSGASENIFVIGATNRIDLLDPAIMRPGRLEKAIYVPLPDFNSRVDILIKMISRIPHNMEPSQIEHVVQNMEGYTGADLQALVREAGLHIIERDGDSLLYEDLLSVKDSIRRSVSEKDLSHYKDLELSLKK